MRFSKKITSLILSLCMIIPAVSAAAVPAAAATEEFLHQDTIEGSAVLHCFNWSYNNIKAKLPEIAAAGYTAVQTSPVQRPKDYNASWTNTNDQWWKMYQPLGLSVSDGNSWLGTKAQLTSLCSEAENYGIKVIVDIVANHVANNGTDGGTYSYVNSNVDSNLKNSAYYHTNNTRTNDNSRYNITQYHLGMPDLNTANTTVQNLTLSLLKDCVDCGVDGFRFDAAKHIELPSDPSNCNSQFWPTVINGINSYCTSKSISKPYIYGEILGGAGTSITNYTQYMSVTDNVTGDHALDKTYWNVANEMISGIQNDESSGGNAKQGITADKSVVWVESHDTYMGESSSGYFYDDTVSYSHHTTKYVSNEKIALAWAIMGSRANSTSLYYARPNSTMGAASSDTSWKSTEVAEVNKFKNAFEGTSEYLGYSGSTIAYNVRGSKGVVISKLNGAGTVSLAKNGMADGTYVDHVSGNTFTVANNVITGTVGSSGIAVVYNASDIEGGSGDDEQDSNTLYLVPNANWKQANARFSAYFYNTSGGTKWVSMTKVNDSLYKVTIPAGTWPNVIFCRMNPNTTENRWNTSTDTDSTKPNWNQTSDLTIPSDKNRYTIAEGAWSNGAGTWDYYSEVCTHSYGTPAWTFSSDRKTATATFTCSLCGDKKTVTTDDITITYNDNNTVYTAYALFNGTTYTGTVQDAAKIFAGHSLTLQGDIGVNFFINVSRSQVINDGVTVDFTWTVNGSEKHSSKTLTAADMYNNNQHRYKATCYVAAAEMTYPVTAKITIGGVTQSETNIYTVKQYTDSILSNSRYISSYIDTYGETKYNNLKTLVQAMLDYGSYAQKAFDRTEYDLANGGTDYLNTTVNPQTIVNYQSDMSADLSNYGLQYVGSTVLFLSKTSIRHYYNVVNTTLFNNYKNSVKMDGTAVKNGSYNGMVYFEAKNISAFDMNEYHTLTIGNNDYNYSVVSYIKKALSSSQVSQNTKNLCTATYRYYQAADNYN